MLVSRLARNEPIWGKKRTACPFTDTEKIAVELIIFSAARCARLIRQCDSKMNFYPTFGDVMEKRPLGKAAFLFACCFAVSQRHSVQVMPFSMSTISFG